MPQMEFIATTLSGLEKILEKEIIELGGENTKIYRRAVSFRGGMALLYKLNFSLRTALRILYKLKTFRLKSEEDYYKGINLIAWEDYFLNSKTIAVNAVINTPFIKNSHYAALKAKDAIVDHFRDKTGRRPDVDTNNPDIIINVHVDNQFVDISLDSSGEPLFKRGYRVDGFEAPLNEVLAAGMIMMTGWTGESDFIDPMCGSATLSIEAAMIAKGIPAGVLRGSYAFQNWKDYDEDLYRRMVESMMVSKNFSHHIYASDISAKAFNAAKKNIKEAMLEDIIELESIDFFDTRARDDEGLMILNPPYGERISQDRISEFYKRIGDHLKFNYPGHTAWILSANLEALKYIGLKPGIKQDLVNGQLKCKYHKYELFKGKRIDFLSK
ncbi:MAG: THUMP domain-containing class I SAM-dependent RNA methyltransferase [Bacteroidales bacterium]